MGGNRVRTELGDAYVQRLFGRYDGRVPREADLVGHWFQRARQLIADGAVQRAVGDQFDSRRRKAVNDSCWFGVSYSCSALAEKCFVQAAIHADNLPSRLL